MRIITLLFLTLTFQTTFSQTWEKFEIDEKVSITIPGPVNKALSGNNIKVTTTTPFGYLTIERTSLPDSLKLDDRIDFLKFYADAYVKGMEFSGTIEIIESTADLINNVKARNILFRTINGQLNQLCFVSINRKMYLIKFKEYLAPSDVERQKIFSSIQIN